LSGRVLPWSYPLGWIRSRPVRRDQLGDVGRPQTRGAFDGLAAIRDPQRAGRRVPHGAEVPGCPVGPRSGGSRGERTWDCRWLARDSSPWMSSGMRRTPWARRRRWSGGSNGTSSTPGCADAGRFPRRYNNRSRCARQAPPRLRSPGAGAIHVSDRAARPGHPAPWLTQGSRGHGS
jgi:hypothetical protein